MIATPPLPSSQQPATSRSPDTVLERIASDTGASLQQVRELYERELRALSSEARITQFVGVIATRRVLRQLRRH